MICRAEESPQNDHALRQCFDSLGDEQWAVRQEAVATLLNNPAAAVIHDLLSILSDEHRNFARVNAALQVLTRTRFDVLPELLALLDHSDRDVRAYTALALGERGDPRAIGRLLVALTDSDPNVRAHTVEALGKLRAAAAVDSLIDLAKSRDFELAFPAIDGLIAIGDQRVAGELVPLLNDSVFKVVTVEALGRLGNAEHVPALLGLLADSDAPAVEIATAVCRIHQRYIQSYGDAISIPAAVHSLASPANVQTIAGTLSLAKPANRSDLITILSWLPGKDAESAILALLSQSPTERELVSSIVRRGCSIVPALLDRLNTTGSGSRRTILECLAKIGDRSASGALVALLNSEEDEELLLACVEALLRLTDQTAYGPLHALFGHPSNRVRQAAVAAINSLGHPSTAADLTADLRDSSPLVRESALRAAASLGLPSSFEAVLRCCGDPEEKVRRAAVEALPIFDDQERVFRRLANALETDTPVVRAAAACAVAKLDDRESAAQMLACALKDGDVWVRYFAVRSLVQMHLASRFCETLIRLATEDGAMQVRLAAVEAIAQCGSTTIPILKSLLNSGDTEFAQAALTSLAALSHPEAQQLIIEFLCSSDRERQLNAIRACHRCPGPDAVKALRPFVFGQDDLLASEAIGVLGQLPLDDAAETLLAAAAWPSRRTSAIEALANLGDVAVPTLQRGFGQAVLDVRRAIVEALSRIRSASALDAMETALNDPEPAVRYAATLALEYFRPTRRAVGTV